MNRHIAFLALSLAAFAVTLAAQRGGGAGAAAGPANPAIGNPQAIQQGEALYSQSCTRCHGKDGGAGEMAPAVAARGTLTVTSRGPVLVMLAVLSVGSR